MRLKRLSMQGFKSFADRTEFEFHHGLSGVIGPNGCGKSNVVDAVKWVLGDQRPTSQRGKEMLDVVFHGAEGRSAMGHAEVTLVLEREAADERGGERVELTIARRLFRSGESEYLLNNAPVRLKDVREALMDTGLGVGGYSVMEQGRIDAVLSANPEERRSIFDEAAGISRYKLRRKEALRRLDKTEINLARVKDLRQEKASRVRSLKIQATRARSYRETEERLCALEVALAMLETCRLRGTLAEVDRELEQASALLKKIEAERETARRDQFELEDEARALAARHAELRDLAAELRADERSRREALAAAEQSIQSLEQLAERSAKEARRVREQVAATATERAELRRQQIELTGCLEAASQELPAAARATGEARRAFKEAHTEQELVHKQLLEVLHDRTRAKNRIRDAEIQHGGIESRRRRLEAQVAEGERKLAESRLEGACEARARENLERRGAAVRRELEAEEQRIAQDEAGRDALVHRTHDLARQRSAVASQLAVLQELEASQTGYDEAARELLQQGGGIARRLVDSIECPAELGPALEAVLGPRLQALVLDDVARIRQALADLAARSGGGRLVLVDPAGVPPGRRGSAPRDFLLGALPDAGAPLIDFCRFAEPVGAVLQELLAGVVLVRDLDAAQRLRAAADPPGKIVTLRGEVVEGAWFQGGTQEAVVGLLQRKAALETAALELERFATEIERAEDACRARDALLARRHARRSRLEAIGSTLQSRVTVIEQRLEARRAREDELAQGIVQDSQELEELAAEKLGCQARLMGPMLSALLLERRERRLEEAQRALEGAIQDQDLKVHAAQDRLSELQSRKAALEAEVGGLDGRASLLERTLQDLRARAEELDRQGADARKDREKTLADMGVWRGELLDYGCRARFVTDLSKTVADNLGELEEAAAGQRDVAAGLDATLDKARDQRSEAMLRQKEITLELDRVDEDIQDDHRIDLRRLRGELEGRGLFVQGEVHGPPAAGEVAKNLIDGWIHGPPLPPDFYDREQELPRLWEEEGFDEEAAAREAEVLRARRSRMGAVNPSAESELAQVQGEHEQLERDCTDLEEARRQLIETLERINVESRAMFERTFTQARTNFQEIFRKLFQGGRADIQLVESEDPLDAGIEILARPPGKELRSIRLLSGGERSLTALAILFAVFQIRPSPFCILDEVDAALDDANVERFLRVLREFVQNTQFLIVTHHKRTMAECKVLYGITMPRKGISTRMSVSLDQVANGEADRVLQHQARMASAGEGTKRVNGPSGPPSPERGPDPNVPVEG